LNLGWVSLYTVILNSILMSLLSHKPLQDIDDVWTAAELSASQGKVTPTGSAELDAQLPGGGWPVGALVEVLQPPGTQCEWRLLLHGLAQTEGALVLVGAAHAPFAASLAAQGLNPQRLLCINTDLPAHRMWAAEQALRCKDVGAVLAWLPLVRAEQLRRLQMAAAEHAKLMFVLRPASAQNESSPAALRLLTSNPPEGDELRVDILKRRGPPLVQPLTLPARPALLTELLASWDPAQASYDAWVERPYAVPAPRPRPPEEQHADTTVHHTQRLLPYSALIPVKKPHHALDRPATAAA
jgi:protein ImuA